MNAGNIMQIIRRRMNMDYKQLEKICKLSQEQLKKYVTRKLSAKYEKVYVGDGYVYAQGEFPVLLVAHLDTVHKERVKNIVYEGNKMSSPQGIGGDDRCGVYGILRITDKIKCSVLFTEDEEVGGIGADKFLCEDIADGLISKFNYIIELDRKGSNDAVFYDCDNPDFTKFITEDFYQEKCGSFSDISYIAPYLKCSAVNLSCGYYSPHTKNEYIMVNELDECIRQVLSILNRTTMTDVFEYIETRFKRKHYGGKSNYGYGYDYGYDYGYGYGYGYGYDYDYGYSRKSTRRVYHILHRNLSGTPRQVSVTAESKEEALGKFFMENTSICYDDVYDVIEDLS